MARDFTQQSYAEDSTLNGEESRFLTGLSARFGMTGFC